MNTEDNLTPNNAAPQKPTGAQLDETRPGYDYQAAQDMREARRLRQQKQFLHQKKESKP